MYATHTNIPVFIDKNILCIVSIMLKMLCSSIEDWIKVSSFPYINKLYFHDIISVNRTDKLGLYACRQEKGTVSWKLAHIGAFWGLDSEADGIHFWKIHYHY